MYLDLRRSKDYADKLESLIRDDSKLTLTVTRKDATTKQMRPRVTGYSQNEYYYALSQRGSIIQYKIYGIIKDKNIAAESYCIKTSKKKQKKNGKKNKKKKQYKRCRKYQRGGFLNCYDLAYTRIATVNQVMKGLDALAPKVIKQATGQVDQIAPRCIQQGGQQVEKVAPKIIKGAIEEVYKTPFRLLGRFGTKQLIVLVEKLKRFLEDNA